MWWDTEADVFTFSLKYTKATKEVLSGEGLPTKRQLLRLMMSIFDPLGMLNSYVISVKLLMQKIWRSGISWDERIPEEFEQGWTSWLKDLNKVTNVKVPRCYFDKGSNEILKIELHVFVDASEGAYAAVAYFRVCYKNNIHLSFIASKSKVAPLKPVSIPRLELMAAVLGVKLGKSVLESHEVKIAKQTYWTDSKVVLVWICSDPMKYKQFVMHRIGEIQESTKNEEWRYIPSKMNVADLATKSTSKCAIDLKGQWLTGPQFLKLNEAEWPIKATSGVEEQSELKNAKIMNLIGVHMQIEPIIDIKRFSKWERLLRTLAYVKLCMGKWKRQRSSNISHSTTIGKIELQWAQQVIKIAQKEIFGKEMEELKIKNSVPKTSPLRKLSPFMDKNDILRMKGRLEKGSNIENFSKNPVILPKNSEITRLLVEFYHRKYKHCRFETVINEIFQEYYILGLRRLLKSVRLGCQACRLRDAQPCPPEMGDLPAERMAVYFRPFTNVGVDFFGPFITRNGRKAEKRYGVVFTCLTCRAVHLEMAHSLSMNSCCTAVRNFIARRGIPKTIFSDNGTNLRATEKELKQSLSQINFDELKNKFTTVNTKWVFLPPASPHMGGAWERMVRSIKDVLYKTVTPETRISDETLQNLLIEAESIINSRPLTYLSLDTAEQEALTPNHFLLGSSSGQKPPGQFVPTDEFIKRSWRYSQYLADKFWQRWVQEFLPTLTKRTKWFDQVEPLQEGDIVIVCDPNSPRYSWPKGKIERAISGKDGQTRSAFVRVGTNLYHRPAVKLAKINIDGVAK